MNFPLKIYFHSYFITRVNIIDPLVQTTAQDQHISYYIDEPAQN
jgi:hypothetical protein